MAHFDWINHLPAGLRIRRLLETIWAELTFPQCCPPGHFYSPIPARRDIQQDHKRIFESAIQTLEGIDLAKAEQLGLLSRLAAHARNFRLPEIRLEGRRYYSRNDYFTAADATMLATLLLEKKPRRYVEIGSGFSSALTLDINDQFLQGLKCSFIEPFPERLRMLLKLSDLDHVSILETRVQDVADSVFRQLEPNDVLFVDSSHVAKIGSDLNDIIFRVLPILPSGVLVHFHDIHWPFEYPSTDVLKGRSWNEAYFLRAFLMNNSAWQILLFGSWLEQCQAEEWTRSFTAAGSSTASSLWLKKTK